MNRFAVSIFAILVCFLFLNCESASIPGEGETIYSNITTEYYLIAEEYFNLENYSKAVEYYKKAANNDELALQAKYKLARAYVFLDDLESAESVYKSLMQSDSENTHLVIQYAYVLASLGKAESAISLYNDLLSKDYYDPILLRNLVLLYIFLEDNENATTTFAQFKVKFPEHEYIAELEEQLDVVESEKIDESFLEEDLSLSTSGLSSEEDDVE